MYSNTFRDPKKTMEGNDLVNREREGKLGS